MTTEFNLKNPVVAEIKLDVPKKEVAKYFDAVRSSHHGENSGVSSLNIAERAVQKIMEDGIEIITKKHGLRAVSDPTILTEKELTDENDYQASFTVEILPTLTFPDTFSHIAITVTEPQLSQHVFFRNIEKLLRPSISLEEVREDRLPQDNDIAFIYLSLFCDGEALLAGEKRKTAIALNPYPAEEPFNTWESVIRGLHKGETDECEFYYPSEFPDISLRGKRVKAIITLDSLKHRNILLSEENAVKAGFKDVNALKTKAFMDAMGFSSVQQKQKAGNRLLKTLTEKTEIPLPDTIFRYFFTRQMEDWKAFLYDNGFNTTSDHLKKQFESVKDVFIQNAKENARRHVYLLSYAVSSKLSISEEDLNKKIKELSRINKVEEKQLKADMKRSGMLDILRDCLLADKAFEKIYSQVKKITVDAKGNILESKKS